MKSGASLPFALSVQTSFLSRTLLSKDVLQSPPRAALPSSRCGTVVLKLSGAQGSINSPRLYDENTLELEVVVVQHHHYTKFHQKTLKMVHFMSCKFHFNKNIFKSHLIFRSFDLNVSLFLGTLPIHPIDLG